MNHGSVDCPYCKRQQEFEKDCWEPIHPIKECTRFTPLMAVIPPGGIHITCPVHPGGHHVFASSIGLHIALNTLDRV